MKWKYLLSPRRAMETMTQEEYYRIGKDGIQFGILFTLVTLIAWGLTYRSSPPGWFTPGLGVVLLMNLAVAICGGVMCYKMRAVWRKRGDTRGYMKASKRWFAIADMGLFLSMFAGIGISITIRRWPYDSLGQNLLHVAIVLVFVGLVIASIWYRAWCRKYWREHPKEAP